jgi:ubiquinone/menaquinone biosynthesis C-methylase UbiE
MKNLYANAKKLLLEYHGLFKIMRHGKGMKLDDFVKTIDQYNATQSNHEMLDAIRIYNHTIIEHLNCICHLHGVRILDIGASPHKYALEKSLFFGASEYVGIGLDINEKFSIQTEFGRGSLAYMNAESLSFAECEFDAIVTMSTFEHINNLNIALSEFNRVLKPGGCVLISFEPIWTCSYGHHLHHFGDVSKLVPDWAHLLWDKNEFMEEMDTTWPVNAPLTLQKAVDWIYEGDALNRKGIRDIKKIIADCEMHVEWVVPMQDVDRNDAQLTVAVEKTGLSKNELMTKGLSILLYKN